MFQPLVVSLILTLVITFLLYCTAIAELFKEFEAKSGLAKLDQKPLITVYC